MSKKICKSNQEWEDVAHFCILKFTEHERAQELIAMNQAMKFISGMIHRSFWSQTSEYYKVYKQKGKMVNNGWDKPENAFIDSIQLEEYDYDADESDRLIAIEGALEDMKHGSLDAGNRDSKLYYMADLFEVWYKGENYSEIERRLGIPRTSVAFAVKEAIEYLKEQMKINNIK